MGPLKQNYIMNQELSQRNSGNGTGGLCYFFKMQSSCLPQYLNNLIPKPSLCYITHLSLFPKFRTKLFRNSFFPYAVNECNNLDNIIKLSELYIMFRKRMLNLIIPKYNETYGIHNPTVLKLLTRMRLGLSHYNYNKFYQNFRDCINPLCPCSLSVQNNVHSFLHCHHFSLQRQNFHDSVQTCFNYSKYKNIFYFFTAVIS